MYVSCQPKSTGEQKTKPTQNTVRELRGFGLSPDLACIVVVVVVRDVQTNYYSRS